MRLRDSLLRTTPSALQFEPEDPPTGGFAIPSPIDCHEPPDGLAEALALVEEFAHAYALTE
jgi:hypothetical protein